MTLLGASLFSGGTDKELEALHAQNAALQGEFNAMQASSIARHEKATEALEIAERAVSAKRNELEVLKKSLEAQKGKDCR